MHIHITIIGFIFLLLSMYYFFNTKQLLGLVIISSVFADASFCLIEVGNFFPINVFYLPATLFIIKSFFVGIPRANANRVLWFIFPLILLAVWAIIGAFLLPHIFAGAIVFSPRVGIDAGVTAHTLLHFGSTNISQAMYMFFYPLLLFCVSVFVSKNPESAILAIKLIIIGFFIVLFVAAYEGLARLFELPFPAELLHNSIRNAISSPWNFHSLTSFIRISSTFNEPSYLSYYLSGIYGGWLCYALKNIDFNLVGRRNTYILLFLCAFLVFITMSTTGYIALFFLTGVFGIRVLFTKSCHTKEFFFYISCFCVLFILSAILLMNTNILDKIYTALKFVLFSKRESTSYLSRSASDLNALNLFAETWGIGVGLGSTRPSSLLLAMLANLGILGYIFFIWFAVNVVKILKIIKRTALIYQDHIILYHASLFYFGGAVGCLLAGAIAVPDFTFPYIWINLAILIGVGVYFINKNAEALCVK
jgi:hypothetical protein